MSNYIFFNMGGGCIFASIMYQHQKKSDMEHLQDVTVEQRLMRLGAVVKKIGDVIAPEKNKALNIWPRFRTQDMGMSFLNYTVQGATVNECIDQLEFAILQLYNSFYNESLSSFNELVYVVENQDEIKARIELELKVKELSEELKNASKLLGRMKKRQSLVNRRNKQVNEKAS